MRKYHLVLFTLIFVAMYSFYAHGQTAKDTVKALKKIEARCQVGVSYKDYGPLLGEAKYEVNQYLESPESKKNPALTNSIKRVMGHYETAAKVWQFKFDGVDRYGRGGPHECLPKYTDIARLVLREYPNASKVEQIKNIGGDELMNIDDLLKVIWGKASEELYNATRLLSLQKD